jgi:hypothetical protein
VYKRCGSYSQALVCTAHTNGCVGRVIALAKESCRARTRSSLIAVRHRAPVPMPIPKQHRANLKFEPGARANPERLQVLAVTHLLFNHRACAGVPRGQCYTKSSFEAMNGQKKRGGGRRGVSQG